MTKLLCTTLADIPHGIDDMNSAILAVNCMYGIVRPIRADIFADEQAFLWIKKKLGLTEYQMAALVWLKGIIIGLLLGWWLL